MNIRQSHHVVHTSMRAGGKKHLNQNMIQKKTLIELIVMLVLAVVQT